jgi:hypothetical protein
MAITVLSTTVATAQGLIIGIDLTLDPFNEAEIVNAVVAYVNQNAQNGDCIVAIAVTARTLTQPIIIAKTLLPERPGIKSRDRRRVLEKFQNDLLQKIEKRDSLPKCLFQQSRIADFFWLAEAIYANNCPDSKEKRMFLVSDMLEVDEIANWERGKIDAQHIKIPKLSCSITISGVQSPYYSNSEMWRAARDAWTQLLNEAGIEIISYSSTL